MTETLPPVDYGRLRNDLKGMFEQQYRAGDRIPSERSLASDFKVSPATISRALQDLSQAGIVRRVRGSGTYLCDSVIAPAIAVPPTAGALLGRTIGIIAGIGDAPARPGEPELVGHRIASAIEREIQSYGGRTRIVDTQRHAHGSESAVVAEALKEGADGLVLIEYGLEAAHWLPPLLEARGRLPGGLPLVLALINDVCEWPLDCVRIDDAWGAFEAAGYLLKQGHRRLAFLSPPRGVFSWADARAAAFLRAVDVWNGRGGAGATGTVLYGPEEHCPHRFDCRWLPLCQGLAKEFLRVGGLTAAVAANDNVALQFMAAVRAQGVRVPEDVSVIGYDNIVEAPSAELCTLDLPVEQMGIQAARLCRQRLENPVTDVRVEMALRPILLLRSSARPLS